MTQEAKTERNWADVSPHVGFAPGMVRIKSPSPMSRCRTLLNVCRLSDGNFSSIFAETDAGKTHYRKTMSKSGAGE